jgi:hypothetical protein
VVDEERFRRPAEGIAPSENGVVAGSSDPLRPCRATRVTSLVTRGRTAGQRGVGEPPS